MKRVITSARYGAPSTPRKKRKTQRDIVKEQFEAAWRDSSEVIASMFPDFPQLVNAKPIRVLNLLISERQLAVNVAIELKLSSIPETRVENLDATENRLLQIHIAPASSNAAVSSYDFKSIDFYVLFKEFIEATDSYHWLGSWIADEYACTLSEQVNLQYPSVSDIEQRDEIIEQIEIISESLKQQAEEVFTYATFSIDYTPIVDGQTALSISYYFEVGLSEEQIAAVDAMPSWGGWGFVFDLDKSVGYVKIDGRHSESVLEDVKSIQKSFPEMISEIRERIDYNQTANADLYAHALNKIDTRIVPSLEKQHKGYPIYFNTNGYEGCIDVGQTSEYTYGGKPISIKFDLKQFEDVETAKECDALIYNLWDTLEKKLNKAFAYRAKYYGDE